VPWLAGARAGKGWGGPGSATEFVLVRHGETTWSRAHRIQVSPALLHRLNVFMSL